MADDLVTAVIEAAVRLDTPEKWRGVRSAAAEIARQISSDQLERLARSLRRPAEVPPRFRAEQGQAQQRQTAWSLLWTETLCEIFLCCRARGVPALRKQAFSGDDRGSGLAFHLLCRLAAEGVERARFIQDFPPQFLRATPDFRLLMVDAVECHGIRAEDGPVGRQTVRDPAFQVEIESLKSLPGYAEAKAALLSLGGDEAG